MNIVAGRLGQSEGEGSLVKVNLTNNLLVQSDGNSLRSFIITLQYDGDLNYIV